MKAKRSENRQRTALVVLRMLPSERQALDRAANERGISVSELVRASVLAEIGASMPVA
ncbi:plasmid mobilization protein [Mycolicibacterium holsaticum]|uniref:plasmid mobilization protein n=1 Tax=Mycolicibacterium holsaticum TaxID=152142 RepID=UPI0035565B30